MTGLELGNTPEFGYELLPWDDNAVRCHVAIIKEDDGAFSAIVLNLPGVASCGDSEDEATANVREAVAETIASYNDSEIPWETEYGIPEGVKTKWILVRLNA
jgi:predicted RNase H-like HicB family nuclease